MPSKQKTIKSKTMKTTHIKLALGIAFMTCTQLVSAQQTTIVGGEEMFPKMDIVSNAVNSKDHTTLVAAVQAAGLVETLQGPGPFTVFAPVNDAFENLPAGTVETLVKPENKSTLTKILTYHVLAGKYDFDAISKLISAGKGEAKLTTVSGGTLVAKMNGKHNITLSDENGNLANITVYDVYQSNGVIHVIDKVVLPN
jgi:uncharacterized surface protein with fasciclin (FAS1) repeats